MKIERNVELPRKIEKFLGTNQKIAKPTTQALIDFVNGTDENVCMTFDSLDELKTEYRRLRSYCYTHQLSVNFVLESSKNRLYITRKAIHCKPREDGAIAGIFFRHGNDDYGMWEGFSLTEKEENTIWEIFEKHDTEGCSVRGTRKQIAKEMEE